MESLTSLKRKASTDDFGLTKPTVKLQKTTPKTATTMEHSASELSVPEHKDTDMNILESQLDSGPYPSLDGISPASTTSTSTLPAETTTANFSSFPRNLQKKILHLSLRAPPAGPSFDYNYPPNRPNPFHLFHLFHSFRYRQLMTVSRHFRTLLRPRLHVPVDGAPQVFTSMLELAEASGTRWPSKRSAGRKAPVEECNVHWPQLSRPRAEPDYAERECSVVREPERCEKVILWMMPRPDRVWGAWKWWYIDNCLKTDLRRLGARDATIIAPAQEILVRCLPGTCTMESLHLQVLSPDSKLNCYLPRKSTHLCPLLCHHSELRSLTVINAPLCGDFEPPETLRSLTLHHSGTRGLCPVRDFYLARPRILELHRRNQIRQFVRGKRSRVLRSPSAHPTCLGPGRTDNMERMGISQAVQSGRLMWLTWCVSVNGMVVPLWLVRSTKVFLARPTWWNYLAAGHWGAEVEEVCGGRVDEGPLLEDEDMETEGEDCTRTVPGFQKSYTDENSAHKEDIKMPVLGEEGTVETGAEIEWSDHDKWSQESAHSYLDPTYQSKSSQKTTSQRPPHSTPKHLNKRKKSPIPDIKPEAEEDPGFSGDDEDESDSDSDADLAKPNPPPPPPPSPIQNHPAACSRALMTRPTDPERNNSCNTPARALSSEPQPFPKPPKSSPVSSTPYHSSTMGPANHHPTHTIHNGNSPDRTNAGWGADGTHVTWEDSSDGYTEQILSTDEECDGGFEWGTESEGHVPDSEEEVQVAETVPALKILG